MESDYVRNSVGTALALGLAEIALIRPPDPVEYLGLWLLKHKQNLAESEEMKKSSLQPPPPQEEVKPEPPTTTDDIPPEDSTPKEDSEPTDTTSQSTTVQRLPSSRHSSRPSSRLSIITEETLTATDPNTTTDDTT